MSAIHPSSSLPSCPPSSFSDVSVVLTFNASLSAFAPSSPILLTACWCLLLAMPAICPSSSLSSCSLCCCSVSCSFLTFIASLSAPVPFVSMTLTVCWCLLLAMSAIYSSSSFTSCLPPRSSDLSVVLTFNTSRSALAPSAPILLPARWWLLLAMSPIHQSSSLSCSHPRSNDWSVVFVANASLSVFTHLLFLPSGKHNHESYCFCSFIIMFTKVVILLYRSSVVSGTCISSIETRVFDPSALIFRSVHHHG